ncbi:family 43 glycosylhydrolase [Ferruginibacter sp.]
MRFSTGKKYVMSRMVFFMLALTVSFLQTAAQSKKQTAYLFVYFTGNRVEDESIHYALSKDGLRFFALNNDQPVIDSKKISSTGGVRDPHILRGADGKTFYMVATDMVSAQGWNSNRAMVLLKSTDLVNWTSAVVNIQKRFAGNDSLLRVWAPQTIYDAKAKKYLVYFSMKHGKDPDKIYYAYANDSFTDLATEPQQLFFSPDKAACIDGDIAEKDGKFYLFFKTEDRQPGIKIAVADALTGEYKMQSADYVQQTKSPVEGAGTFKLNDGSGYILMYDMYTSGSYQFTKTTDFKNFTVLDKAVSMNFHPRHGTVLPVTAAEAERLMGKWGTAASFAGSVSSPKIRTINTSIDTAAQTIYVSVKPGTRITAGDLSFASFPAVSIQPSKTNVNANTINYTIGIANRKPELWKVKTVENNNPVLNGLYADPDIIYSEKNKKYYIYPTSDGFNNWSGTYFKTFSSTDLVNWKEEGIILDLEKDVNWAKRNAWAPCILEKKINGQYKYFFYFCAAQKIGVAVADDPAGPFVDMGKPLIDKKPEGIKGGQEIDPDVFTDPVSGKTYLYWGNSYMAVAEMNDDMISIKQETLKVITPTDKTFREGTTVFYRNGKYYFMWSEDDTRSENYRVRYGIADAPTGPITIPANNLVLAKDTAAHIYATGHNSVIQVLGKDQWYIVYHRFNYPKGINMGRAAGYNREVCIDVLQFNADGTIQQTIPTHKGITALQ